MTYTNLMPWRLIIDLEVSGDFALKCALELWQMSGYLIIPPNVQN